MVRPLIAGNWKMNGVGAMLPVADEVAKGLAQRESHSDCLICPPATLIARLSSLVEGTPLQTGGQDCHANSSGAHTGDIAADMIADAGGRYVIVGHSERRADHHESDEAVSAKAKAAEQAGLVPIICVGETLDQRKAGKALDVIEAQIASSVPDSAAKHGYVIAYEPVWAIGTGEVATPAQVREVHDAIRAQLMSLFGELGAGIRILYGGSMKPGNAAELLAIENVNGGLIGGASLKAADFLAIYDAAGSQL